MGTKPSAIEQTIQLHQAVSPMLRDTNALEKNIRTHNLRGNLVGGLEEAAAEERRLLAPNPDMAAFDRLQRIAGEIQEAASRGDTKKIRQLIAERESIDAEQARRSEEVLAPYRRRVAGEPAKGEEQNLEKRLKKLDALATRKQTKLAKLRDQLIEQPEDVDLHARIEDAEADLGEIQPQVDSILARQRQIADWKAWKSSQEDIAKAQVETATARKEREKDEKSLVFLSNKITKNWLELRGAVEEFQAIVVRRMTTAGLHLHYNLLDDLRMKMNRETNGACVRQEGIVGAFSVSDRIQSVEQKVSE